MLNGRKVTLGDSLVSQKHEDLTYLTFLNPGYHHLIAHNLIHIMVRSSLGSAPSRCFSTSASMASMTWRAFS